MKIVIALAATLLLTSCARIDEPANKGMPIVRRDTVVVYDTVRELHQSGEWQKDFGLTHDPDTDKIWGKPVSYYLSDSNCSGLAEDFYNGYFRPSDNGATSDLLALAVSDNETLRPFYRWCLDRTVEISDGALSELTGQPARENFQPVMRANCTGCDAATLARLDRFARDCFPPIPDTARSGAGKSEAK